MGADAPLPVFGDFSESAVGSSGSITIEISQDEETEDDKGELAVMFMGENFHEIFIASQMTLFPF